MHCVTYHHIELSRHDVVLAEGLPAESFLDMKDGSNYPELSRCDSDRTRMATRVLWEGFNRRDLDRHGGRN